MNITVESCPSDCVVPRWVVDEIANGHDNLLVIYPNEDTRSLSIRAILDKAGSVDSSRHTTLQRLIKSLSIDFRLPVVIPKTSIGIVQVHDKFATAAAEHRSLLVRDRLRACSLACCALRRGLCLRLDP